MDQNKKNNVLVIAAHPDDEILGCGASIARHIAEGDVVQIIILGEGITSRKELDNEQKKEGLKGVHDAAEKASEFLGVDKLILKNFPDNRFDTVALLDIAHSIEEVIGSFRPTIIYTQHYSDVNIDHRRTAEAVETATRPMRGSSVEKVFSFEVASSTEWNFIKGESFRPNVFIDVGNYFQKKIEALSFYESEMRKFPHPRSIEYITALARVRGGQSGFEYAEAFELNYFRK